MQTNLSLAILLAIAATLPTMATEQLEQNQSSLTSRQGRVKGLVWIEKRKEKPHRLYHYALFDTEGVLIVDHKLKGYDDLRKFDEAHPKIARGRDWGYALGGLFMVPLSLGAANR